MVDTLCNNIKVLRFINNPVPSNAFLVLDSTEKNCVVIDPGSKYQGELIDFIRSKGLILDYIIITHEHFDHYWGVNALLDAFPAKVIATKECAEKVLTPQNYFNELYYDSDEMFSVSAVDVYAEDINWHLPWKDTCIRFVDAKGHTKGSMCINIENALFSGDTMVYDTKPVLKKKHGASLSAFRQTIETIFDVFKPDTIVYSGHGEPFRLNEMREFYQDYFICVS